MKTKIIFLCLVLVTTYSLCEARLDEHVYVRLKKLIFSDYDKEIRPGNDTTKLVVNLYIVLVKLHSAYDDHDSLSVTGHLAMAWNDTRLVWNPADYGNITRIYLNNHKIWTPIPAIMTSINSELVTKHKVQNTFSYYTSLQSKGIVFLSTVLNLYNKHSICDYDVKYWPRDQKVCKLRIGFPPDFNPNIKIGSYFDRYLFIGRFLNKNEWEVVSSSSSINNKTAFEEVEITLFMRRTGSLFGACVVTPAIVVLGIAIILLWMDPRCTERVILTGLAIVCQVCSILTSVTFAPKVGSETPYVVRYTSLSLFILVLHFLTLVVSRRLLITSFNPFWLTTVTTWFIKNPIFSRMFFLNINQKMVAELIEEDEEESLLIMESKKLQKQWQIIVWLINFTLFIFSVPVSAFLFAAIYDFL